jgi:hypothetical protein
MFEKLVDVGGEGLGADEIASVAPAAARAAFRFSPTWRIWAPMSPLPTISPAWLRASRPDTKISFPAPTVTTGE